MSHYGSDPEDIHESMHIHRRERHYNSHKLAVAVGHNRSQRKNNSELIKRKPKKVR